MTTRILSIALSLAGTLGVSASAGQAPAASRITVPDRSANRLFQSQAGELRPLELTVDAQTRMVTIKLSVEDPSGYFIPNLRREHFTVYEDGMPQTNVNVDVEHAPVSLSVLLEGGGRYQELNRILTTTIPVATSPLLDALLPEDKVAAFSYADKVNTLAGIGEQRETLKSALTLWRLSGFSEANLYDALIDVLDRTLSPPARRGLLLVSTGIDSFSHATFDDVVAHAERANTPVYAIGLAGLVQRSLIGTTGPLSKINWNRANQQLKTLATTTDGRAYLRDTELDIPAVYDDLMEHLRLRYVITYASHANGSGIRKVRVSLVDPATAGPLRVQDSSGKSIVARVSTEATYVVKGSTR